jgi:hypothetical protein
VSLLIAVSSKHGSNPEIADFVGSALAMVPDGART